MKQRGLSLELISQESDVGLEVLKQFLPQVIQKTVETHTLPYEISLGERACTLRSPDHCKTNSRSTPMTTEMTKQSQLTKPQRTPAFFYCCDGNTNSLLKVNLLTGEQSCYKVPSIRLEPGCRLSELPGGSLHITGG
jgi:hypothetical protein